MLSSLKKLEEESIRRGIPIIGDKKGKFLLDFIKKNKPKEILELGTANGYSDIILGSERGRLTTVDINSKISYEARENFNEYDIDAKIIIGDCVRVVKELIKKNRKFDLIFIDFEKAKYIEVLEDCIRLLNKNGTIITDNINFDKCEDYKERILNHDKLKTKIIDDLAISHSLMFW